MRRSPPRAGPAPDCLAACDFAQPQRPTPVIPTLRRFLARHLRLKIRAILVDRNVGLAGEGVDGALRLGVVADSTMTARMIGQSRRVVVGTRSYFEKAGEPSANWISIRGALPVQ
jgi:hypothetical protein